MQGLNSQSLDYKIRAFSRQTIVANFKFKSHLVLQNVHTLVISTFFSLLCFMFSIFFSSCSISSFSSSSVSSSSLSSDSSSSLSYSEDEYFTTK